MSPIYVDNVIAAYCDEVLRKAVRLLLIFSNFSLA